MGGGPPGLSPILLAVSGGPDSMALLALVAENRARLAARGLAPHVATVDHGLRPASAGEALVVAETAAACGLPHRTLRWTGDKPRSNLQAAAREARYALLVEAARTIRAGTILTAHHEDDQVETHCIARARRAGDRGLAGMRARRDLAPGLVLARPFLGVPAARLRATAIDRAVPFTDDPSNADPRFERVRWRQALGDPFCERRRLVREIARHAVLRDARDLRLGALLAALRGEGALDVDALGTIRLDGDVARRLPADLATDVLGRLIRAGGGGLYPPSHVALVRLLDALAGGPVAATLGGAVLTATRPIRLFREYGRIGPLPQTLAGRAVDATFDRRFAVALGPEPPEGGGRRLVAFGAFGRGNAVEKTLPVLATGDGRIERVPDALRQKAPEAAADLGLGEEVSWRLTADLPLAFDHSESPDECAAG